MTQTPHTQGAIKAANIIKNNRFWCKEVKFFDWMVETIDRETHLSEMIEALETLTKQADSMNNRQHAGIELIPEDWSELYRICNISRELLKKVRG